MADPRHQKLAQVLIHYSLSIHPGDKLMISSEMIAAPLVREVYREALRAGAYPTVRTQIGDLTEIKLREASEDQLRYMSDLERQEVEYFDAVLFVWAEENTKALTGIDPSRIAIAQQTRSPWRQRLMERAAKGEMRWCGTLFPTQAYAQDAAMSLEEYEGFVYGAGLLDRDDPAEAWRQLDREQKRVVDYLTQHDELRVHAPGTDLTCRVGGRKWESCAGTFNFPDGEVFTAPIEDSVNGTVRFTYPAIYSGREVEDVRLVFHEGKVVKATASRGQELLEALLDQDPGARYLGEFAFGTNYSIQRFTRNILFDEKIGGTMHLALGQAYPETGGVNRSGLHWDMICDLHEGEAFADGERFYAQGKFTL